MALVTDHVPAILFLWVLGNQAGIPLPVVPASSPPARWPAVRLTLPQFLRWSSGPPCAQTWSGTPSGDGAASVR